MEGDAFKSNPINYKPLEANLSEGLKEVGQGVKGLPHIVIGNKNPIQEDKPIFSPKQQAIIDKVKQWGLILAILLIVGYSIWRFFR